jgi:hypothetical protein
LFLSSDPRMMQPQIRSVAHCAANSVDFQYQIAERHTELIGKRIPIGPREGEGCCLLPKIEADVCGVFGSSSMEMPG